MISVEMSTPPTVGVMDHLRSTTAASSSSSSTVSSSSGGSSLVSESNESHHHLMIDPEDEILLSDDEFHPPAMHTQSVHSSSSLSTFSSSNVIPTCEDDLEPKTSSPVNSSQVELVVQGDLDSQPSQQSLIKSPLLSSKSPNSKIQDLIESPILNKGRMLSPRLSDEDLLSAVAAAAVPTSSDSSDPTARLIFTDSPPELFRTANSDHQSDNLDAISTPAISTTTVDGEKLLDASPPEARDSQGSSQDSQGSGSWPKLKSPKVQRPITSYLVPRGSPRAMAMLKAAGGGSGKSPRMQPVAQVEPPQPSSTSNANATGSGSSGSSDSDSNSSSGSSGTPSSRKKSSKIAFTSPSSANSSSSMKRSFSYQDQGPSSPQGSPKRSGSYVPMSRGSMALMKAKSGAVKSPLVFSSGSSTTENASSSTPSSASKKQQQPQHVVDASGARVLGIMKGNTPTPRKSSGVRVSFATPLVTSELLFDANSIALGLDTIFTGSPSFQTLKVATDLAEGEEEESPRCAIKKMKMDDSATVVTSIEFRSRDNSVRQLRSSRTCVNLFSEALPPTEKEKETTDQLPESSDITDNGPPVLVFEDAPTDKAETEDVDVEPSTEPDSKLDISEELTSFLADMDDDLPQGMQFSPEFPRPPSPEPTNGTEEPSVDRPQSPTPEDEEAQLLGNLIEDLDEEDTMEEIAEADDLVALNGLSTQKDDAISSAVDDPLPDNKIQVEDDASKVNAPKVADSKVPEEEVIEVEDGSDDEVDDPSVDEIAESPILATGQALSSRAARASFAAANNIQDPSLIFSTIATTLSSNTLSSSSSSSTTVATPTTTIPPPSPLISSSRALSILKQAVASAKSPVVFVEKPPQEEKEVSDLILESMVSGGPSSPPSSAISSSSSASNGSFGSPFVRRGSACLQAAKQKQAEIVRQHQRSSTPHPKSRIVGLDSVQGPNAPKSILRQSISDTGDEFRTPTFGLQQQKQSNNSKKRVIFSEPLVSSSVEFDSTASNLVICDNNNIGPNSTISIQSTSNSTLSDEFVNSANEENDNHNKQPSKILPNGAGAFLVTDHVAAVDDDTNSTAGGPCTDVSSSGSSDKDNNDDGGMSINEVFVTKRKRALYHQNSTFIDGDCDSFARPSKRRATTSTTSPSSSSSSQSPKADYVIYVGDSDVDEEEEDEMVDEVDESFEEDNSQQELPAMDTTFSFSRSCELLKENCAKIALLKGKKNPMEVDVPAYPPPDEEEDDDADEEEEEGGTVLLRKGYQESMQQFKEAMVAEEKKEEEERKRKEEEAAKAGQEKKDSKKEDVEVIEVKDDQANSDTDGTIELDDTEEDVVPPAEDSSMIVHAVDDEDDDEVAEQVFPITGSGTVAASVLSGFSSSSSSSSFETLSCLTQKFVQKQPSKRTGHRSSSMSDDEYAGSSLCRLLNSGSPQESQLLQSTSTQYPRGEDMEENGDGITKRLVDSATQTDKVQITSNGAALEEVEDEDEMVNVPMPLKLAKQFYHFLGKFISGHEESKK